MLHSEEQDHSSQSRPGNGAVAFQQRIYALEELKISAHLSLNPFLVFNLNEPFIYANDAFADWTGYTSLELEGLSWKSILQSPVLLEDHSASLPRQPLKGHIKVLLRNGTWKDGYCLYTFVHLQEGGTGVAISLTDLSTADNMKADPGFHSYLLDSIRQSVIVTSLDGTIRYWNKFATNLYGWQSDEVIGKNIVDVTPSGLSVSAAMRIMERLQKGEHWAGEFEVRHRDGRVFFVFVHNSPLYDHEGRFTGILGVSCEVSAERKIREQIRLHANMLDSVKQAVIACDEEDKIIYWNRFAEELYGWEKEEVIGKEIDILLPGIAHYDRLGEHLMLQFKQGKSWEGEFLVKNKTGNHFLVYTSNSPITDENGKLRGIIAVSHDISQRKLEEQQKEFDRLDKEALINSTADLLWSVSKDFKLIAANRTFIKVLKQITGYELNPGQNVLVEGVFPEEYLQFWKSLYERALSGETVQTEILQPDSKESNQNWSEVTLNPIITGSSVVGVACHGRDITERKQNDAIIRQSERRFRTIFDESPLGIALIDSINGKIYDLNSRYAAITGRSMEELKRIDWMSITHPDDIQEDLDNMARLNRKEITGFSMQKRYIRPDGSIVWIQMSIAPLETIGGDSPRHLCMIDDITKRKQSEEELKKLSIIAKETVNAVIITNPAGGIEWVNEGFTNITGYTAEEVLGKKPGHFLQGKDTDPRTVAYLRTQIEKKEKFECEILNYSKYGHPYWVLIQGQPIYNEKGGIKNFFAIETNISENKAAEERIRYSEEQYRYLFNNIPASIIIWHPEDFSIADVNNTALLEYGYTKEEFLALNMLEIRPERDRHLIREFARTAIDTLDFKVQKIWRHLHKSGRFMYMQITSHRIMYKGRLAILASIINISEKLQLQRKLRVAEYKKNKEITKAVITAQENERASLGRELHDNVNQILVCSRLYLKMGYEKKQINKKYLRESEELIMEAIDELRNLSHDLIPPSVEAENFMFSMDNVFKRAMLAGNFQVKKIVEGFDEHFVDSKLRLIIYRIIQEQLNNIVKYAQAKNVWVLFKHSHEGLILSIKDDGIGFDTTKKGSGVGLLNMNSRAAIFNGSVSILSAPNKGCEVLVRFPINPPKEESR